MKILLFAVVMQLILAVSQQRLHSAVRLQISRLVGWFAFHSLTCRPDRLSLIATGAAAGETGFALENGGCAIGSLKP